MWRSATELAGRNGEGIIEQRFTVGTFAYCKVLQKVGESGVEYGGLIINIFALIDAGVVIPGGVKNEDESEGVAALLVAGETEAGLSEGIGEEADGGFVVIAVIVNHVCLSGAIASKPGVIVILKCTAPLEAGLLIGVIHGVSRQAGPGVDEPRGPEAGLEETRQCLRYIEGEMEYSDRAAALLPRHGDNRADAREFFMQRRIQCVGRLHRIPGAAMEAGSGFGAPDDGGVGRLLR